MDFNPACRSCPRLYHYLQRLKKQFPDYHNGPVPLLGVRHAPLAIVGLAPGLHGANASGQPFTGDASGVVLFKSLYAAGISAQPTAIADASELFDNAFITNAVKCLPPGNKPTSREIRLCNRFLKQELSHHPRVIVALGKIAHDAILKAFGFTLSEYPFAHAAEHQITRKTLLLDSYHCSRYNIQTNRLTEQMFTAIFYRAAEILRAA